jgi:predicted ATPase/transcriptional regulator with XRE-family HTH domain
LTDTASFGTWLRHKRKALDLTRQDLAERAACAVITIEKIEIGQRRPSKQVAEALAAALHIPAAEHDAFIAFARGQAASLDGATAAAPALIPNNLPHTLPVLIGRDEAITAVRRALAQDGSRWITLTGPGGVGKTSLALHVAAHIAHDPDQADAFKHGVVFVDLSPIRDSSQVAGAIGSAVATLDGGAQAATSFEALADRLAERAMLLVLDNFEQVSEAALQVARFVQARPQVKVLVTSRVALHAEGVRTIVVAPLSHAAAASLFLVRARESEPHFQPNSEGAQAIDALCHRLDGLPLAIELVAARVKLMSPQALLARLTGPRDHLRIDLVADGISDLPARQRTMREAIAWSYHLLASREQALFRRWAVFEGGCDLPAVEALSTESPVATWNALTLLIESSLLRRDEAHDDSGAEEPRFSMFETVREFALAQLQADPCEEAEAQLWHAAHFRAFALQAEPHVLGPQPATWLRRLTREQANLRAALHWHAQHDATRGLRLCVALSPYWHTTSASHEGRSWLQLALDAVPDDALDATRAAALYWLGRMCRKMHDWADALRFAKESVARFRALGDVRGLAPAMLALGWATYSHVGKAQAGKCFEEGLALYRQLDDRRGIAQALLDLSHIVVEHDADYERATRYLSESRALFRQIQDDEGLALVSSGLAIIACIRGDYARCRMLLLEGLEGYKRIGAKGFVAGQYLELGEASYFLGDFATAEQEWQTSLRMHREIGSRGGIARTQFHLARLRRIEGQLPAALDLLLEALTEFQRMERTTMSVRCVAAIGGIALVQGQPAQGAVLLSAAQRYFDSRPPFLAPADVAEYDRDVAACREQLGDEAFDAAWVAGQAMTLAQACEIALRV